ncbi:MAG: hypothetical protein NZ932_03865 [Candidatus Bathyarchaeota archaeon]|nr:hypothetical protein [Candidatus Bathyarchaeota archaeon]MDW8022395.1 hypothetical protein [Nitrososphaerota archaeon]
MKNTNKPKTLTAISLVFAIAIAFVIGYYHGQLSATQQEVAFPHMVNFTIIRNGKTVYNYTTHNILTTIGARFIRNILCFDNETQRQVKYIALSSDTSPSKTWTKLPNEYTTGGLERKAGTPSTINATAFQVVAQWTSSTTTTIKCTGLHWSGTSGSDNNLFAVASIPDASVTPGDIIQVTWTINTKDG